MQKPDSHILLVGRALKEYRKLHGISQEQLAAELGVDPRTLRSWENERPPESIRELRRISDLLGIEPERLGLAASLYLPKTPEQVEEIVARVWALMDEARVNEAFTVTEKLVHDVRTQIMTEDRGLLVSFAHALHVAGYVASMRTKTSDVTVAIDHYHELESVARLLNDPTLLLIALTYQGDMYRRLGNIQRALDYLEAAQQTAPQADRAAQGNAIQLLGRVHFLTKNMKGFESSMAKAEELAATPDPTPNSTHGHYSLGTVYEEYGKSYALLGQMQKALDYLSLAERHFPKTTFWEVLLMIARAEAFIYGGEIEIGKPLAVEAAKLSRVHGHYRRLERIQSMRHYLHRQALKLEKAEADLDDALDGPIEQWNTPDA